jgi:hypothetical protein
MTTHANSTERSSTGRRSSRLLLGAACAAALTSAVVLGVPLASAATRPPREPAVVPTSDIVGTGSFTCKTATGEVGYSPASGSGTASSATPQTISIWFDASGCSGKGQPVPKTVLASMSFPSTQGTTCPLFNTFGSNATLNLAYNYPPVPATMIDPSVVTGVTISDPTASPYWTLTGTVTQGSYLGSSFSVMIKPNGIGTESCASPGITSEYIARLQGLLNV